MRYDQLRDEVVKRKPGWEYLQEVEFCLQVIHIITSPPSRCVLELQWNFKLTLYIMRIGSKIKSIDAYLSGNLKLHKMCLLTRLG